VAALEADPRIDFISPNGRFSVAQTVQGDQTNPPWGLDRIDQPNLPLNNKYSYPNQGEGVDVYIVDSGIRGSHQEFGGRVVGGYTVLNDGWGTGDCVGHGTHVAGTVGAATYGVAKKVNLYAIRVAGCSANFTGDSLIAGLNWVAQNADGPSVINMSLGGEPDNAVDAAVRNMIASGIVVVIASGNYDIDACNVSPARVREAITVNASTNNDARAGDSNWGGACTDIFAPGVDVLSAVMDSDTSSDTFSGTSMAAPHVAGGAALYLAENPDATPAEVADALYRNATLNVIRDTKGSPNRLLNVNPRPLSLYSDWDYNGASADFEIGIYGPDALQAAGFSTSSISSIRLSAGYGVLVSALDNPPVLDFDGDGVDDDVDPDDDNDNVLDGDDAFPRDPEEWNDSDGDGVGDNADPYPNDPFDGLGKSVLGYGYSEQISLPSSGSFGLADATGFQITSDPVTITFLDADPILDGDDNNNEIGDDEDQAILIPEGRRRAFYDFALDYGDGSRTYTFYIIDVDVDGDADGSDGDPEDGRFLILAPGSATPPVGATMNLVPNSLVQPVTINYADLSSNTAPILFNPGNQSGNVAQAVSLPLSASDADGDSLSYRASGLPAGLNVSGATISGTPTTAGSYSVTVLVEDGNGGSDSVTLSWTIEEDVQMVLGDVNCSDTADTVDALFIMQYVVDPTQRCTR